MNRNPPWEKERGKVKKTERGNGYLYERDIRRMVPNCKVGSRGIELKRRQGRRGAVGGRGKMVGFRNLCM